MGPTDEAGRLLAGRLFGMSRVRGVTTVDGGIAIGSWRWWFVLIFVLWLVCWSGCGGCGGSSDGRAAHYKGRWGGMSEAEWRALNEKRQKEEEEEERRAREEAKRRQEEERRKQEEAARQQAAAHRKQRTSGQPTTAAGHSANPTNASASSDDEDNPPAKPKTTLPEAFDQWKPEHFLLARRQAPQRLVEAIAYLVQNRRSDPELVDLLLDMVWTEKAAPAGHAQSVSGRTQHTEAILRAVADALASLQTPKAVDGLRQLLSGQTPTEDHPTAIRCVLAALAAQPTPDHDRLLLQAILGPENLLHGQALLQAQSLQQEALRVLSNQARPELQEQLARYVEEPALSPQTRQKIEQTFLPNRWEHFRANLVLVQSQRTSTSVRSAILRQLAVWSAQAAQMLAVPEGIDPAAEQAAQARQVAESVWRPEFASALAGPLAPIPGPGADGNLQQAAAQLAMTIPASWARQLLADWLAQRWPQRPDTLRKAVDQSAFEPGFLVLIGRLVYEQIDPIVPVDPSAGQKSPAGKVGPGRPNPNDKLRQQTLGPVAKEWLSLWDQASVRLTQAIFQDLSGLRPIQTSASSQETPPAQTPTAQFPLALRLSPQAKLLTEWTGNGAERAKKLGWDVPVEDTYIYIIRWQLQESLQGLASRLERSLPQARRRPGPAELVLEIVGKAKETARLQMVQIRIRSLTPEIPRSAQEQQPLLLEALCVQIADPASTASPPETITTSRQAASNLNRTK